MTDNPSINQLMSHDPRVKRQAFEDFYSRNFHKIEKLVLQNSGNTSDAKDLFQESMIVLYHNIRNEEFRGAGTLDSYFYGICKRTWLNQLRKGQQTQKVVAIYHDIQGTVEDGDQEAAVQRTNKLLELLEKVSQKCKSVLTDFYFYQLSVNDIMDKYQLGSPGAAKNKKYRCMQQLIAYSKSLTDS